MSLSFGCALIKKDFLAPLRRKSRFARVLAACNMRVEARGAARFDPNIDMSEDTQLSVITALPELDIWTGFSLAYMVERMHNASPALPNLTGLFVAQEGGSGTFIHQSVVGGRYGGAGAYPVRNLASWHRSFPIAQGPPARSQWLDAAVDDLAAETGAPRDLVSRAYTGMSGGGLRGLTWHSEKNAWVLAKSLADTPAHSPTQALELNPRSYAKRGTPFAVTPRKGDLPGFLPKASLFYEIQHRAIAAALGARLDTMQGLSLLEGQPCQRFDIWLDRGSNGQTD